MSICMLDNYTPIWWLYSVKTVVDIVPTTEKNQSLPLRSVSNIVIIRWCHYKLILKRVMTQITALRIHNVLNEKKKTWEKHWEWAHALFRRSNKSSDSLGLSPWGWNGQMLCTLVHFCSSVWKCLHGWVFYALGHPSTSTLMSLKHLGIII